MSNWRKCVIYSVGDQGIRFAWFRFIIVIYNPFNFIINIILALDFTSIIPGFIYYLIFMYKKWKKDDIYAVDYKLNNVLLLISYQSILPENDYSG